MPIQSRQDFSKINCPTPQQPIVNNYYPAMPQNPICTPHTPNIIQPVQVLTGDITRQTDGTYWVTGIGGIPISYHTTLNNGDVLVYDKAYNKYISKQLADVVNSGISISTPDSSILIGGTSTAATLAVNVSALNLTAPVNTAITNLANGSIPATKISGICTAISNCQINTSQLVGALNPS